MHYTEYVVDCLLGLVIPRECGMMRERRQTMNTVMLVCVLVLVGVGWAGFPDML